MKLTSLVASVLLVAATAAAQTCAFTNFGRPCGGSLAGSQRGPAIAIDLSRASPGAHAVLLIGQAMRPAPLPTNTLCAVLVDPRLTARGEVDRAGNASFLLRLPAAPIALDFQVVTADLTRTARQLDASNGVHMTCR